MASIASAVAENVTMSLSQIMGTGSMGTGLIGGGTIRPTLIPNSTTTTPTLSHRLVSTSTDSNVTGIPLEDMMTTAQPHTLPHPVWLLVILGILAGVVAVVTIVGNITVLLAFGLERTIRQPTNYFLASLAVSDLLIGTFSMPLYTQYLLQDRWPLGPWLCDLWLSLDWTVCLTSQYTVFLITMDRFLSVKIPAKYRNWRTERKVLIMVAVTWIGPACVFFTSIIGWQFFVGKRTVNEFECEVPFMTDAWFTFFLTIAYYWITLFVMCILYGGIYKVALDLQRKSDAKQRKMQSTMELAGDNPAAAIRNFGDPDDGMGEGSNNNSSGGADSNIPPPPPPSAKAKNASKHAQNNTSGLNSNRKSIKAALPCPTGAKELNTTSFSEKKKKGQRDGAEDERSSSPAFDSDDENITGKSGKGTQGGLMNSALFANTGGLVRSLHGDMFFNSSSAAAAIVGGDSKGNSVNKPPTATTAAPVTPGTASGTTTSTATTSPNYLQPPPYSSLGFASDTASDAEGSSSGGGAQREVEYDSVYSSSASDHRLDKQTTPLLPKQEQEQESYRKTPNHSDIINKGRNFIDEKSFLASSLATESSALLPAMVMNVSGSAPGKRRITKDGLTEEIYQEEDEEDSDVADLDTASSPIWKRRTSLPPLATDVFDLEGEEEEDEDDDDDYEIDDDDRSDCLFITEYTTTTSVGEDFVMTPTTIPQYPPQFLGHGKDGNASSPQKCVITPSAPSLQNQQRPRADTVNTLTSEGTTYADTVTDDYSNSNSNASPYSRKGEHGTPNNLSVGFRTDSEDVKDMPIGASNNIVESNTNNNNNNSGGSGSGSGSGSNFGNATNPPPSETNTNEDSSRSESHCLAAVRRRRDRRKDHNRLHTFVKSVRSRNSRRRNRRERKSKSENRARKALRTISFILGAFVLCWTPYHVIILILAICSSCVNVYLYKFSYWMCYLNSPINPFCYAFANAQFKRTFLRIMRFDWHRT